MKNNCDIVQDLLPLYLDGICSEGSRKFVEEHISECEKCSGTLSKLKNTEYDKESSNEDHGDADVGNLPYSISKFACARGG